MRPGFQFTGLFFENISLSIKKTPKYFKTIQGFLKFEKGFFHKPIAA
jgi:hypothetical protein